MNLSQEISLSANWMWIIHGYEGWRLRKSNMIAFNWRGFLKVFLLFLLIFFLFVGKPFEREVLGWDGKRAETFVLSSGCQRMANDKIFRCWSLILMTGSIFNLQLAHTKKNLVKVFPSIKTGEKSLVFFCFSVTGNLMNLTVFFFASLGFVLNRF